MKVIVVLPAYNEGPHLCSLLSGVDRSVLGAGWQHEVVLVDDGSTDGTAEVLGACAKRFPLTIIRHERNCGLGAAIRDGLIEALRRVTDADVVVTMDADETHTPSLILKMVEMIRAGCDVVVASRFQPGAKVYGVPLYRRVFSFGASQLCRILFPTPGLRDFTCGYRAYRASLLRKASLEYGEQLFQEEGFCCVLDLLLRLRALQAVFREIPITLLYDLKAGKSKMRVWSTILDTLALLARRRMGL